MKLSAVVNSRCAGTNHVHFTITANSENDTLIGVYPLVLTSEQLFNDDVENISSAFVILARGLMRELGYTSATPITLVRTAVETKVFRV